MKKFKSMKTRDEKMESLLMEKWGYPASILNEDGDKELLQEVVVTTAVLGTWALYAAIAAVGTTYAYSVYKEKDNREIEQNFNNKIMS